MSIEEWIKISNSFSDINDCIPYEFSVRGASMLPLIRSGMDSITIVPCSDRTLKAGDIILFRFPESEMKYMLHRIKSISDDGEHIVTMGDGNPGPDRPIIYEDVVGYAIKIRRGRLSIDPNSKISRELNRIWMSLGHNRRFILRVLIKLGGVIHGT